MKKNQWVLLACFTILLAFSCNDDSTVKIVLNQKPIQKQAVRYKQYITADSNISNGIIVILDPHSKPQLIMDSLHQYANQHNMALLGIKDVHNGVRNYNEIINRDLDHFIATNNIERSKIYLIGFSGTARMAEYYAYSQKIDGLIMCGAGMNRKNQLPFPTVLISGTKDFNFVEQYYDLNDKLSTQKNIISFSFDGIHKWPPTKYITAGMDFIIYRKKGGNDSLSNYYYQLSDDFMETEDYYLAFKSMEIAYKYNNHNTEEKALERLMVLKKNKNIKNYYRRTNLYLGEEVQRYRTLSDNIDIQDLQWWKNQVNFIKSKSNKKDAISANSYARTLGYLGLVTFSKINLTLSSGENITSIDKYIEIYGFLEPESPYLHFYKAVLLYRNNNNQQAMAEMQIAIKNNFDDDSMLQKYFADEFINSLNN